MSGKSDVQADFMVDKLLELACDGIVVVDAKGMITLISRAYADFLGIKAADAIGKHVSEVIENTRLPQVLESGKAETAQLQLIKGAYMVASRYPLHQDGRVVGAVGKVMFRNIHELNVLHERLTNLQYQLEHFRNSSRGPGQAKYSFHHITGISDKLLLAKSLAEKAALTDANILLQGESGTGKELFAHAIHQASARAMKPFVKVNCAAIPRELMESELFGYQAGAFTGAAKGGKPGKFEVAHGGTIFLDEVGDMPLAMQAKLLRVLQEKEIEKVGAPYPVAVDVRIIAATNRNLEELTADGSFRNDLFYRLNVFGITIPTLRERPEDIEPLITQLLEKLCDKMGRYVDSVTPDAMQALFRYDWPGNVRELENTLERAITLMDNARNIELQHLPDYIGGFAPAEQPPKSLQQQMQNCEKAAIQYALKFSKGKKAKAAKLLHISRSNLYERMTKLNLSEKQDSIK